MLSAVGSKTCILTMFLVRTMYITVPPSPYLSPSPLSSPCLSPLSFLPCRPLPIPSVIPSSLFLSIPLFLSPSPFPLHQTCIKCFISDYQHTGYRIRPNQRTVCLTNFLAKIKKKNYVLFFVQIHPNKRTPPLNVRPTTPMVIGNVNGNATPSPDSAAKRLYISKVSPQMSMGMSKLAHLVYS